MNASPRGWCPGVHQPMSMADGLMVRVKPHAGVLPPLATDALAEAAAREGCAAILLTSRANLQLRGLTAAGAARFAAAMIECGLADADPGLERRRNLIVSPLAGIDPTVNAATRRIADAIVSGLRDRAFEALPDKFGFVVDGGGCLPLGDASGDVRLRADGDDWRVGPDGAASSLRCRAEDAPVAALELARGFLARGGWRRMRDLQTATLNSLSAPILALGGGEGRGEVGVRARKAVAAGLTQPFPPPKAQRGAERAWAAAFAPPGGIITPDRLAALARQAALRLTPWRVLLLPGLAELPP